MKLKCSNCGNGKPKTEDGKFLSVDTGEWDSSFYLFCSEECKNEKGIQVK